jgi:hypothetical protein
VRITSRVGGGSGDIVGFGHGRLPGVIDGSRSS